jgi:polyphosphate kinase
MTIKKQTSQSAPPASGQSATATPVDLSDLTALLFNRELSLLEFYRRVLEEALDQTQPLLERLKFLSILASNLDEFFMIRVSGLKETSDEGVTELSPDGMTPRSQLKEIRSRLLQILEEQMRCWKSDVLPGLKQNGIFVAPYDSLSEPEKESLNQFFMRRIFPMLTPQAIDSGHPFPYISGLSLNLGLMVGPVRAHGITQSLTGRPDPRFTRIKIPPLVPRLIPVVESGSKFVLVEELVAANVRMLFPRMHPSPCYTFRVTRDADVEIREDEAEDLLRVMERTLRKRRFGSPIRLEVSAEMPREMISLLVKELELTDEDVYKIDGPLDMTGLMSLYQLERPELKDKPFTPPSSAATPSSTSSKSETCYCTIPFILTTPSPTSLKQPLMTPKL